MIIATLIRRAQLLAHGLPDPFPSSITTMPDVSAASTTPNATNGTASVGLAYADGERHNKAILRLVYVLEQGLNSKMSPRSAIEWALERGSDLFTWHGRFLTISIVLLI